jgi:hypothetical protein
MMDVGSCGGISRSPRQCVNGGEGRRGNASLGIHCYATWALLATSGPNKRVQATASSVRSSLAPAASRA